MSDRTFDYLAVAPGRVNLLGEHVDYNGGPVLPAAIDLNARLEFSPRKDNLVTIEALNLGQKVAFHLDRITEKQDTDGNDLPGWALYPAGVAWSMMQSGVKLRGLDGRFSSTVPIGSGLSSSAAMEVAFAAAWNSISNGGLDNTQIALLSQKAENQYVGVNCGIMDQFASANGVEGHAIYLDTRTLEFHPVPLPPGTVIIIADSGVRRSLHNSEYNIRRAGCEQAVTILSRVIPGIQYLRDVSSEQLNRYYALLPYPVNIYARHIVEECERVDQAVILLDRNDAAGFGKLMFECHTSLRDLYRVSAPELDILVDIAAKQPGCLGARLTGAGFGGCTVNLVEEKSAGAFIDAIKTGYQMVTGKQVNVYQCIASAGVKVSSSG
jgi:galactokinase